MSLLSFPLRLRRSPRLFLPAAPYVGGTGFVVWFVGFDPLWSVAIAAILLAVGSTVAGSSYDCESMWPNQAPKALRGTRLATATLEQSLLACDRLARPKAVRLVRALVINEREDQLARAQVVRQLRALLAADVRSHGFDPAQQFEQIAARFGPETASMLQLRNQDPVTTAAIERCLKAIEQAATFPENQ